MTCKEMAQQAVKEKKKKPSLQGWLRGDETLQTLSYSVQHKRTRGWSCLKSGDAD